LKHRRLSRTFRSGLKSALGGLIQGVLSIRGPVYGVPQMALSRFGFGYWANALPAGLDVGHGRHRLVHGLFQGLVSEKAAAELGCGR